MRILETGGHCCAYLEECSMNIYFLITDTDGCDIPKAGDDFIVGLYDNGQCIIYQDHENYKSETAIDSFIAGLNSGELQQVLRLLNKMQYPTSFGVKLAMQVRAEITSKGNDK